MVEMFKYQWRRDGDSTRKIWRESDQNLAGNEWRLLRRRASSSWPGERSASPHASSWPGRGIRSFSSRTSGNASPYQSWNRNSIKYEINFCLELKAKALVYVNSNKNKERPA